MNNLVIFGALFAIFSQALCYDWGDDSEACSRMRPLNDRGMREIIDRETYRIVTNTVEFNPGQKVHVRILGKEVNDKSSYTGLLLTVTEVGVTDKCAGSWDEMHPNRFRRLPCFGEENVAIAESLKLKTSPIPVEDDVFVWNAPQTSTPGTEYYLRATVVKSESEILTGLSIKLRCVPAIPKPTFSRDSCAANYSDGLMETSWETDFGGWWNDPMSTLLWTRKKGPTRSPFTGPPSALDGDYYIYSEGSYPAKEGETAILNSPRGLNGCFCVRMKCFMWMGKGSYFEVRVNGVPQWQHLESTSRWIQGRQSINDANYPQVQFVAHRGEDFRSDLAVDDLQIVPGLCPEDFDDDLSWVQPVWENIEEEKAA